MKTLSRESLLGVVIAAALGWGGCAGAFAAQPAPDHYVFRSWSVEDGLPQATVTGLALAPEGYMWVATFGGLALFDGLDFRPIGEAAGLPRRIVAILCDHRGVLWVAPEAGGLWQVTAPSAESRRVPGLDGVTIRCFLETPDGDVLLGTAERGVLTARGGDPATIEAVPGAATGRVLALARERSGALWVGAESGMSRLAGGQVWRYGGEAGAKAQQVTSVLSRADGTVWVGDVSHGLATITAGRLGLPEVPAQLAHSWVSALLDDRAGNLWIGSSAGLYRHRGGRFERVGGDGDDRIGSVRVLLEDGDGNLWVGTDADGLHLARQGPFRLCDRDDGLPSDTVLAVAAEADGSVLVAPSCGPIMRVRSGLAVEAMPGNEAATSCFWSLLRARDGTLWAGSWGAGVVRFRGKTSTRIQASDGLGSDVVVALFESRAGDVWVGTQGGGASRISGGTIRRFTRADGLPSDDVRYFAEAADGSLWLATSGGLSHWDGRRFANLTAADGLTCTLIRCLHIDRAGYLWAGTYGGGLLLVRGGAALTVSRGQGLLDDVVSWIGEDDDGGIWLTGNRGIFRILRAELLAVAEGRTQRMYPSAFGIEDGMRSPECNGGFQPAGARSPDGLFWFPTIRGLVSVDPRALTRRPPRRAMVEGVRVDGQALPVSAAVPLPRRFRTIEIQYCGLDLVAARKLIFRYRLVGADRDWVDAGGRRAAYYGNLPAGRYRFEVQAFSPDGGWGAPSSGLGFEIPQVIWLRWWFLAAGAGLVSAVIFSLGVWRQKRRQRHEREHIEIARRLTAGILHEFRQPLQVLRTRLEIAALRQARPGGGAATDDVTRALDRLDVLLASLDRLQTVSGLPTRPYGHDESMADLVKGPGAP